MKVLIIEDEKHLAQALKLMLHKLDNTIEVLSMIASVREGVAYLNDHSGQLDLIFSDIELQDGLSFEVFEATRCEVPIIFTTAYDQYAISAFKVNSIDYLLKPIVEEELQQALEKFSKRQEPARVDLSVLQALMQSPTHKTRFVSEVGKRLQTIEAADAALFASIDKSTYLFTLAGKKYLIEERIDDLSRQLNPKRFFQVNRKYIVAIDAIDHVTSWTNSRKKVVLRHLNHKEMIIVARERTADFKEWLRG